MTSIGDQAFYGCSGLTGNLIIPEGVTSIRDQAFYGCSGLTGNLTIPNSVTSIEAKAFYSCSGLTGELRIPEGMTSIGEYAFQGCSGLTGDLIIPNSVTSIGKCAFIGCSGLNGNLRIPESVTSIGLGTFQGCSGLTGDLIIPEGVTSIGSQAFYGCSGLTGELRIPEAVTSIEMNAFSGCSGLTGELRIPEAVTSIGSYAFYHCYGFNGRLTIGNSVEEIGNSAFGYTNFESVYLPTSLKTIGDDAFNGYGDFISKYKVFICAANTPPTCGTYVFQSSTFEGAVLYVPEESVTSYQEAYVWSNFKNIRGIKDFSVENVFLNKEEVTLKVSESVQLDATIISANTTDSTISWASSDPEVATVDENGLVTAISVGTATITATTANGAKAACVVTVEPIPVESVEHDATDADLIFKETVQLLATILPENATDKSVTWFSSDPEIATVDENGLVTAISVGTATIYATATNWIAAACVVTVEPTPVESVKLDATEATLRVNETAQLQATLLPENATDKSLTWTSSDPEIATVDENGLVTALSVGTATITATTADGISADCVVTVEPIPVESVELDATEATLRVNETVQLLATLLPENATDKSLTWASSDPEVATVDENGLVTAISIGTATITVTPAYGVSATCVVTVEAPLATSIALDLTEINAVEGSEIQLTATVLPELASEQELIWSTTNENVATVTETGLVTIVAEGNAEIVVTTTDGSDLSATCQVLGTSNVSEIFLTPDATVSIYTMTGTLIKANATKEDFAKLVKGIYIINGKKVMVK